MKKSMAALTTVLVAIGTWGTSMSAFGFLGFGNSASWKEEVLLHDGTTVVVERHQRHGGRHEIGQPAPVKEEELRFTVPATGEAVTWLNEYGEALGGANFKPLALHILRGIPYIVASPRLCLAYNKWGRPNPPYIVFKRDGTAWGQIALSELPTEFDSINLTINTVTNREAIAALDVVSASDVRRFNKNSRQPQYREILRTPLPPNALGVSCESLIYYKGAWIGPGDSIGRRMMDSTSK